ncbi:MAG: exonuclease domain-containing protein [Pseudomonadota bacterium]|nr:exonuclease domain-containing protein [Pseudomonadota bacterium]
MPAPRRPRPPGQRGLWLAVAGGALALAVWMALLAGMVWSTWSLDERARAAALLSPRLALLVLGWLAGAALIALGLRALWQRHVQPPARLAEAAQALLAAPGGAPLPAQDAPALPAQDAPALHALAQAFNTLLARHHQQQHDMQAQIDQASARVASERNRLAALLAQLHQGVVVCNLDGSILLYNPRARLQLHSLPHGAAPLPGGASAVGIGRSIYSVFDQAQVQHALARVQASLRAGQTQASAQFVTATHGARLLRVQLAPVLAAPAGPAGAAAHSSADAAESTESTHGDAACTGFMLTLEDITRSFDTAAERDRWLAEATGHSGAAVAVLTRLVGELAPADGGGPAWQAVRAQCETLRAHTAALARHAADGLATRWPLEDMLAADLLAAAQHHLARAQPVRLAVEPAPEGLWLRVDSYLVLQALASLAERLSDALPLRFLGLRLAAADDGSAHAHLDLFWDGLPISTQTVMTWELEPVGAGAQHAMLTLRDVLDRHRATLAFGRDRRRHEAFLRFVLPLAAPADAPPPVPLPAASGDDGRPEFYDFDLFQTRPHQGALDDQPLAALIYTVFDTETTGLNPSLGDEVIQIGATRIVNGRLLRHESWEQLICPSRPISAANSAIHGITNEHVRGQPRMAEVLPAFHAFARGTVLVAHNAAFDMKFLQLQEAATGLVFDQPVLDTLLLATVALPQQASHRLDALVQRFGIALQGQRHTALADALATAQVLLCLIPLLQAQGIHTLGQARAAAQQSYLARLKY